MSLQQANVVYPMASLYVGDLHPDVTEGLLYEKFNAAGQVISLRICRDTLSKRSLGYGYVNFSTQLEAERALDTMNFDLVKGKPMRLMWCQRNPSLRKSGIGNVFIKNLDKNIDNKAMYDTFSAFGTILSCKVALDEDGDSKGYGFVHFESVAASDKAIEKVNGMLLNGKKVYVGKFLPKMERDKHLGDRTKLFTNIYVKNFDENLTDDQFRHLFAPFGTITSSVVMKQVNGASKCFGFVAFDDPTAACDAVSEMNGKELSPGQCLYVGRAQKKGERQNELKKRYEAQKMERYSRYQGTNLYVKNLDDNIDDERIAEEFSTFGTITSAKVMMENGRSKGFGFVCYSSTEEAQKAMTEMNGHLVGGKPLYVALAQRKEDRRAFLNNQFFQRYRQHTVAYTPNAPPFLIPAVQGPRFFNHLNPMQSHVRNGPRWGTPSPLRNGTIMPPLMSPYRSNSVRQQVQANNLRNAMHARPITGTQQAPTSRPNSKYTNNSPSVLRQQVAGLGAFNGGDNTSPTSPQTQKQIIGERLFRVVEKLYPEMAGKITGMLLEIDNSELIQMIENQESLKRKVEEAIAVLQAHQAKKQAGLVVQE